MKLYDHRHFLCGLTPFKKMEKTMKGCWRRWKRKTGEIKPAVEKEAGEKGMIKNVNYVFITVFATYTVGFQHVHTSNMCESNFVHHSKVGEHISPPLFLWLTFYV
ncbi:unnamed protein product [Cuscuta epithymum]|uniref:Transmembrane protein n=1 Tax=Cuscuta epithymum TaxID=186058 RepID=A0AAV0FV38_9ASTE|nr:unnamed protein product [Cuscuta epithymum]